MIYFILACTTQSSFESEKKALGHFNQAKSHYDAKNYDLAVSDIDRALKFDPTSRNLTKWKALILFRKGEAKQALAIVEEVLLRHPGDAELRYNRAAILVSQKRYQEAVSDLKILYNNQAAHPTLVSEDPDFEPLVQTGEFSEFVPKSSLRIHSTNQPEKALLGEALLGQWEIVHRHPITFQTPQLSPFLDLHRVVEVQEDVDGVLSKTSLSFSWTAIQQGEENGLRLRLESGQNTINSDPFGIEVVELKKWSFVDSGIDLVVPSQWVNENDIPWIGRLDNGWALVVAPPNSTIRLDSSSVQDWELRENGLVRWIAKMSTDAGKVKASVSLGDKVLLSKTIPQGQ